LPDASSHAAFVHSSADLGDQRNPPILPSLASSHRSDALNTCSMMAVAIIFLAPSWVRRLASVMNMNHARCQCEESVRQAASTIKGTRLWLFAVIPDPSQRESNARRARQGFPVRFDLAAQRHEPFA
jgi:hypothetical protein